jgi:hypothetical protein
MIKIITHGAIDGIFSDVFFLNIYNDMPKILVIINLVAYFFSLFAVALMWQLKKLGFFIYVAAQVIALALAFTVGGLIFTALFIVLYFLNFKHME